MKGLIFLCVALVAVGQLTAAKVDLHKDEIQILMRKMMLENERNVVGVERFSMDGMPKVQGFNLSSCACHGDTCGCCVHLKLASIHLDDTVCLNVSYLPQEIGVMVALILDGKVLFSKKVSAKNPPAICADIPHLKKLASLCLRLYDLDYASTYFSGCAQIEAELAGMVLEKVNLGCFKFPIGSSSIDKRV